MSEKEYNFQSIEKKAQQFWEKNKSFEVEPDSTKEKFYCLSMFPYPSGQCHMGHVRNYTIGDVISRFHRLKGKNVLQPMGWDAFGLPAENAAIQNKVSPQDWTEKNIEEMKLQLKSLGFAYDWRRELKTCSEDYYKWEQWLFCKLYEKGLVIREKAEVNWDPVDKTVLANEQVVDGKGWRSGAVVEKKEINQWSFRITDFAEELLNDLELLDDWPDQVKIMQKNWIGKSEGVLFNFNSNENDKIEVFTTRPDTIMGVTFVALSFNHEIVQREVESNDELLKWINLNANVKMPEADLSKQEKKGFKFSETLRSGFIVSIVGKPNSGKSTLINKLAKRNVAITSRISGTTRDIIELRYNLDGIPIVFLDTAGIRKSKNKIEKIGISKSLKKANKSHLRVILSENTEEVLSLGLKKSSLDIVLRPKGDLKGSEPSISGKTGKGVDNLLQLIKERLSSKKITSTVINRTRHLERVNVCINYINNIKELISRDVIELELLANELRGIILNIDGLLGLIDTESMLGEIFSNFCIGK